MIEFLSYISILAIGFIGGFLVHRHYFKPKVTINVSEFKSTGKRPVFESKGEVEIEINLN
jgi:hypothetical protein